MYEIDSVTVLTTFFLLLQTKNNISKKRTDLSRKHYSNLVPVFIK